MQNIRREFIDKFKHINLYFEMLEDIIQNNATLNSPTKATVKSFEYDLKQVLKANVVLLLYNSIESTVRQTIEQIHISFNSDGLKYPEIQDEFKKIWIEFKYNNFKDKSSNEIFQIINAFLNDEININYEKYIKKRKSNDLSGNVDALVVRDLASKYGFVQNQRVLGRNLVKIKNQRNSLAHGNETFLEIGKNYDYPDLLKIKKEAYLFLTEFMNMVEMFINNKTYKV